MPREVTRGISFTVSFNITFRILHKYNRSFVSVVRSALIWQVLFFSRWVRTRVHKHLSSPGIHKAGEESEATADYQGNSKSCIRFPSFKNAEGSEKTSIVQKAVIDTWDFESYYHLQLLCGAFDTWNQCWSDKLSVWDKIVISRGFRFVCAQEAQL